MFLFGGTGRGLVLAGRLTILLLVSLCPTGVQGRRANGDQTCSCTGGCAPNQVCESTTSCKKENVAYGKDASISSVYGDIPRIAGPGCVAVNGRTGHVMRFTNENDTNCVHTTTSDNNASWSVDLGRDYTVTDIVIYSRENLLERLAGIWIYVDNNICKKFPTFTYSGYGLTYTAVCDSPLRGQIVTFTKEGRITNSNKLINFCEVQIWVCKSGTFGQQCNQTCHCKGGSLCDNYYGNCTSGCADGYYGNTCSAACGRCHNDAVCDDGNGHCPGACKPGYQPPLCQNTCPHKTYGDGCTQTCGQCKDGAACNVFNGTCPTCRGNFSPPLCKSCGDGFYDDTCTETCGQCKDGAVCDASKGHCPNGCEAGYVAPLCQDSCLAGYYGDACTGACGHCTDGAVCDSSNGHCSNGCETGYAEPLCLDTKTPFSTGAAIGIAALAVMILIFTIIVVTAVVWLWRRKWVLPCAETIPRPADEEMEYRGTHATRGEQDDQRDTGIYEIPDSAECSPPSEVGYRATQATRGEQDDQWDTGIYEIQDSAECSPPSDLNPTPSNYDLLQTSDMGQESVYSSLSAPNDAGQPGQLRDRQGQLRD